jgi:alcohol dehydrogenase class IV
MEFNFTIPSVIFGEGSTQKIGDIVKDFGGKNVFVIYDAGVKAAGIVDGIIEALKKADLNVVEFDKVLPNPPVESVEEAAEIARKANTDVVVAIGGGSSMDTAKCVKVLLSNPSPITQYEGPFNKFKDPLKPLIAIPTTAGTGSEVTSMAIITDPAKTRKFAVGGRDCYATVALADPLLTVGLPPFITASTGIDALTHAIEAYTCKAASPMTDVLALKAISIIYDNVVEATRNGKNIEARSNMLFGSLIAGAAFSNAMVALAHSIAHPLSAHCNLGHGVANACVLPYVVEFNAPACPVRTKEVGIAMGLPVKDLPEADAAKAVVQALLDLNKEVGIPTSAAPAYLKISFRPSLTTPSRSADILNPENAP